MNLTDGFTRWMLWGSVVLLSVPACRGISSTYDGPPPVWLTEVQRGDNEMCAVGVSGPTYYAEDAQANSKANALTELGRAVRVTVSSNFVMHQHGVSSNKAYVDVEDTSTQVSRAVLERAEVRARWVNSGDYPSKGERGTVYTWMCLPVTSAVP